jgi:hypothetical protein
LPAAHTRLLDRAVVVSFAAAVAPISTFPGVAPIEPTNVTTIAVPLIVKVAVFPFVGLVESVK